MKNIIDKSFTIEGLMKAGYTREQGMMIADVANNAAAQCNEKIENAVRSLPENLRVQCFLICWQAVSALSTNLTAAVIRQGKLQGCIIVEDEAVQS